MSTSAVPSSSSAPPFAAFRQPLPPNDRHAISVSLPTWDDAVRYTSSDDKFFADLQTSYPRLYQHASVRELNELVLKRLGASTRICCAIFPSLDGVERCEAFVQRKLLAENKGKCVTQQITFSLEAAAPTPENDVWAGFSVLVYPLEHQVLEHVCSAWSWLGDGISSRHADFCVERFDFMKSTAVSYRETSLVMPNFNTPCPHKPTDATVPAVPWIGRDQDIKRELKGCIYNLLISEQPGQDFIDHRQIFLYAKRTCAIGEIARLFVPKAGEIRSEAVVFGIPYGSTPKYVKASGYKYVTWYEKGSTEELDELERSFTHGARIACLFCELPANPLHTTPDLARIRSMADKYIFPVIIDDTVGNFIDVDVLRYADILITSLSKVFSGSCNVMGGAAILNHRSWRYDLLKKTLDSEHKDLLFPLDAEVLLQNSRGFPGRVQKANKTARALVELIRSRASSLISSVNNPFTASSLELYDEIRRKPAGGYGSLITVVFKDPEVAVRFYDAIDLYKGPGHGANFTLLLPYAQVAHAHELEWAEKRRIPRHAIRISVGQEDETVLLSKFREALNGVK